MKEGKLGKVAEQNDSQYMVPIRGCNLQKKEKAQVKKREKKNGSFILLLD